MRPESALWLEQARKDLEVAGKNHDSSEYYAAVFFCQQAVEKALKSVFIERQRSSPGTTHSLVFLASKAGVPEEHMAFLQDISPEFVATRYPDVADEAPYKLYNEKKSATYLENAKRLFAWIDSQTKT